MSENRDYSKDVFCGDGGRLRASLQGISETKSCGDRLKARTDGGQLASAQTIPPSALTSAVAALTFPNPLPKAPVAILHPRRIFFEMGLFSVLFKPEDVTLEESAENLKGGELLDFPDSGTEHRTAVSFHRIRIAKYPLRFRTCSPERVIALNSWCTK